MTSPLTSASRCEEGTWVHPAGRKLHYRLWQPQAAKALLVLVHGFGEHSGRYQALGESLAREGCWVAAPDLWGHGRSGGARGEIGSVERCAEDVRLLTEQVFQPRSGYSQHALFGHSFGGLAAIMLALSRPAGLRRLIIQSPLLEVAFPVPRWKTIVARLLCGWWPTCSLATNLDAALLSHDPAVGAAYRADPLVHGRMSARSYCSILQSRDDALRRADELDIPTLLLYGEEDHVVSIEMAKRWFALLRCEKRSVGFPKAYHELHHEAVRLEALRLTLEWALRP